MAPTRIALVAPLGRLEHLRVATQAVPGGTVAVPHPQGTANPRALAEAAVLVVDLFDDGAGFDRCPGVHVLRSLPDALLARTAVVADRPVADVVRVRLMAAGAQVLLADEGLSQLLQHLDEGGPEWRPARRTVELDGHGILATADVEGALAWIRGRELESAFDHPAERPWGGLSRRRAITLRTQLADLLRMRPVVTGSGAMVTRTLPSWSQLRRFVDAARGANPIGGQCDD